MNAAEPRTSDRLALSPAQFQQLAEFITRRLGIKMSEVKIPMLQSRLQRRIRDLGLPSLEDYQRFLFSPEGEQELEAFFNAVTTNKTDFFREPGHFEFLTRNVLPSLCPAGPAHRFKLWCAGCSSGEEAYTQSMVLTEYAEANPGFSFRILATDISTRVLHLAEEAIYDESRIEPISEPLRRKYLLRSRDRHAPKFRICGALRERVQFHQLNFMDEHYPIGDTFDVIFIRNVMIYFDRATQTSVVRKLCRHLRPGGFLFIGHSESLNGLDVPVRLVAPAVYRKDG
jgi:chemotaxis protein methyltransferase CheR